MKKKKIALVICVGLVIIASIFGVKLIVDHVNQTIARKAAEAAQEAREETTVQEHKAEEKNLLQQGYLPLELGMQLSGYSKQVTPDGVFYRKEASGVDIKVHFDWEQGCCSKNQYQFSIEDSLYELRNVTYIKASCLEAITNDVYTIDAAGNVFATPIEDTFDYASHPWTAQRIISHAGGGYRDAADGYISYYTNSYEALTQNYNVGSRVFEFDFALTTDGRLAAVHDWENFANKDGNAVSSVEWENTPVGAKPETEGAYTSMFVEDILDEMLVNRDMFLVTDMKIDGLTEEEVYTEFEVLCEAAKEKDVFLLNRIVPQVYNIEMYDSLMEIYEFPSIIFTCYRTEENAKDIIDFCHGKDNIHVITAKYEDKRFGEEEIESIHEADLLLYNYTISGFTKMYECFSMGVDGIYSNSLLPQDIKVYEESLRESQLSDKGAQEEDKSTSQVRIPYEVLIGEDPQNIRNVSNIDVLVIDAEYYTAEDIAMLKSNGVREIYTYLNVGSIENFRSYYATYEKYTLGAYDNWPEEQWVDVSKAKWQKFIVSRAEELAQKGVDGFFIDNTDVYYMYPKDKIYDGLVKILSDIKALDKKVVINGGDAFVTTYLQEAHASVIFDAVNQENVYTCYDFDNQICMENNEEERTYFTDYLDAVKQNGCEVYVLEFATEDAIREQAYTYAKEHDYICFVSKNIELTLEE